jgi:predicted Fe-Mo cluster-binding NifX family protein
LSPEVSLLSFKISIVSDKCIGANGIGEAYVKALSAAGFVIMHLMERSTSLTISKVSMYALGTWTPTEVPN